MWETITRTMSIEKLENRVSTIEKALGIEAEGELISFEMTCKYLEIQPATLRSYITAGKLKPAKGRAAKSKFKKIDIEKLKK